MIRSGLHFKRLNLASELTVGRQGGNKFAGWEVGVVVQRRDGSGRNRMVAVKMVHVVRYWIYFRGRANKIFYRKIWFINEQLEG